MKKENNNSLLKAIIWILVLIVILLGAYVFYNQNNTSTNSNTDNNITETNKNATKILIISDKRCTNCGDMQMLSQSLKTQVPSLANATIEIKDFKDDKMEDFVKKAWIKTLPAVIFDSNNIDPNLNQYLQKLDVDWKYLLNIWATFDPFAEICGNWIDDDNNWKTDCEDEVCKDTLACAPKVDKPKAELYVMSYCPYGTQAQKWFLQVMDKLGKVADTEVHFVNYIMHWEKEWEQNLREYCIQKEQPEKFHDYLQCFLKAWDFEWCLDETNIDKEKLNKCVTQTKKEINYDTNMADTTRRFPLFDLETENNQKYGVAGSPTFVLNWKKVENVWRSAKAYADLICNSFKEKPEECNFDFDTTTYDPNFWFTSNGQTVSWGCGG